MSIVHHEPVIDVVPCLGCDELIAPTELYKHGQHDGNSCCFWHPYHFWCIRTAPPAPATLDRCAECNATLSITAIETMARWANGAHERVHRRSITVTTVRGRVTDRPDLASPRPPLGLRFVCVWWPPNADTSSKHTPSRGLTVLDELTVRPLIEHKLELVHDTCPGEDPWRAQLRAAPGDNELRVVYADYLEEHDQLERADFVRAVIRYRSAADAHARLLALHLDEARQKLPGSWCRDVASSR